MRDIQKKAKNCKGFTLVELTISIGILAFVLTAFLSGIVGFTVLGETARDKTIAVNYAKKILEEIQSTPFSSVEALADEGDVWKIWLEANGGDDLKLQNVAVTINDRPGAFLNLLDIEVTLTWETRNRQNTVKLATSRTNS